LKPAIILFLLNKEKERKRRACTFSFPFYKRGSQTPFTFVTFVFIMFSEFWRIHIKGDLGKLDHCDWELRQKGQRLPLGRGQKLGDPREYRGIVFSEISQKGLHQARQGHGAVGQVEVGLFVQIFASGPS
jgi:hypothetical protein